MPRLSNMLLEPCRCVHPAAMSAQRALARLFSSRSVVDVLESRGMVHAMTSRALKEHLSTTDDLGHHVSRTIYTGVDPSAASLHLVICSPLSPCFIVRCMDTKLLSWYVSMNSHLDRWRYGSHWRSIRTPVRTLCIGIRSTEKKCG